MLLADSRNKYTSIKTRNELIKLINEIRVSEGNMDLKAVTAKSVSLYCNPGATNKRYCDFQISKKSGGFRTISAPVAQLKAILWPINFILSSVYEPKPCVMGFTKDKGVADNAKAHLGQNYILNLDLKDFFPSIQKSALIGKLMSHPFNYSKEVALTIAGLCTVRRVNDDGTYQDVLPQGAPTSPILTNIICETLDRRLLGIASRYNLRYTRYADDITFSSMHNALSLDGEVMEEIKRVISSLKFTINESKTRLQKKGARQEVTGLIVSNKVNTPRKYVRDINQILYVWGKFGYEAAYIRLVNERSSIPGKDAHNISLENVIGGKLAYLKMVKGANDCVYQRLYATYLQLCDTLKARYANLTFLAQYTITGFENAFKTELKIDETSYKYPVVRFTVNGRSEIAKIIGQRKFLDIAQRSQTAWRTMYISLCMENGKLCWIAHTRRQPVEKIASFSAKEVETLLQVWERGGIDTALKLANILSGDVCQEIIEEIKTIPEDLDYE